MRVVVILAWLLVAQAAVAADPPCEAPISRADVEQIKRVIRAVTTKPILAIMATTKDSYFRGAIIRQLCIEDVHSGKRKSIPQYTRSDLVSVYMGYTDSWHVDVYLVRKVRGRWRIEEKKNWFV